MNSDLEIHDPQKHGIKLYANAYYKIRDDDFYVIRIISFEENMVFKILNHEYIHCVLSLIEENSAAEKYNGVYKYVDWVHWGTCELDGDSCWKKIIDSRTRCIRCGERAEIVDWNSDILCCTHCQLVYDEKEAEIWRKLSKSKYSKDLTFLKELKFLEIAIG